MKKSDYNRIAEDKSQLNKFKNDVVSALDKLEVTDIEHLTNAQLDALECGDRVIKVTGKMKHAYTVTYKEEGKGICISYYDCGYLETISYDCSEGEWTFNSKDIWQAQSL